MLKKSALTEWIVFALILIISGALRFWHYGQFPIAGETLDEYAWSTLGASLIQQHIPASWSAFGIYQGHETGHYYRGWPVVSPVLDHPPLFSFIPGIFHALTTDWWQLPSIMAIRFPMVILGVINLGLFILVTRRWLDHPWSYLAGLIFATAPLVVFSSRLVLAENLLQTILLLFFLLVTDKWRRHTPLLLLLLSTAAILTKAAGIVLPLAVISWYIWQKNYRPIVYLVAGSLMGLMLWAGYGWLIDWRLFWAVQSAQGARDIGLTTLFNRWFLHPALIRNYYFDGWWWLGWIGFIGAAFYAINNKLRSINKFMTLGGSFLVWHTLFIMVGVGESTFHGWYDFTILPILIAAVIYLLIIIWRQKLYLAWWIVWLLLLSSLKWAISFFIPMPELPPTIIRIIIGLGLLPFVISLWHTKTKWARITVIGMLIIILTANVINIVQMNDRVYSEFDTFYLPHRFN